MKYLAEAQCQRSNWAFTDVFRYQYVITHAGDQAPGGYLTRSLSDWRLHHCSELPVCALALTNGEIVALVVGYAVTDDGVVLEGNYKLGISARADDRIAKIEAFISSLAGRYTALLVTDGLERVYPDPTCGFGPVFHARLRRLGASTGLVLDRELEDNPDIPRELVVEKRARHLFGHTADAEAQRAISNHYIDLKTFSQHRFWPGPNDSFDAPNDSQAEIGAEIGEKLGLNIRALAGRFRTALPITGGTDSRVLLAAARDCLDEIPHYYVYQTNWANSIDLSVARDIAEMLCLPLRVITAESPVYQNAFTPHQFRQWIRKRHLRGGFEPDTAERGSVRATSLMPKGTMVLRGNVAEMTRALRWHRRVFDDPHNTEFAMGKLEVSEKNTERYGWYVAQFENWKAGLPAQTIPRLYDFLHTELWVPQTNAAGYMRELNQIFINPFNDRRLIGLTTSLPPGVRRRMRLVKQIVEPRIPGLNQVDYWGDRHRALKAAS